jgi:hypothetical protein
MVVRPADVVMLMGALALPWTWRMTWPVLAGVAALFGLENTM